MKEVNWVMHPSNSSKSGSDIDEADARIGLFYSRAARVKAKMLLNIEHVIFINL
jgi:hypothetical protein